MDIKIIETPIGKQKVEIKTWLTGRDTRDIRNVYLEAADIKIKGKTGEQSEIAGLSGKIAQQAEDKAIEIVVIAIDGKKEDILNRLLNMRTEDYEFVIEEINSITGEKKTI